MANFKVGLGQSGIVESNLNSRVMKVYDSESYDYPIQIQESLSELGNTISSNLSNFATTGFKVHCLLRLCSV